MLRLSDFDRELIFATLTSRNHNEWLRGDSPLLKEWSKHPGESLGGILVREGVINSDECQGAYDEADERIAKFEGNAEAALSALEADAVDPISCDPAITLQREEIIQRETYARGASARTVIEDKNRYRTIREQGSGGAGRVMLVYDRYLGRSIALKELLVSANDQAAQASETSAATRFLREARLTSQLEHPGIVPVYEVGRRKNGSPYYTMKLVKGMTLADALMKAGTVSERLNLLSHFQDLCHTIAYAHSRDVIHRDIKPGNIMVGRFGETVVLDWGLAKIENDNESSEKSVADDHELLNLGEESRGLKTAYGQIIGTPAYMAPEQARGDLTAIGVRTDIYALGAVLYSILTGRPPFERKSAVDTVKAVLTREPEDIQTTDPSAPSELCTICRKAMAKDASQRYATASELIEDVSRFQTGALVEAHEYHLTDRISRLIHQHRGVVITAVAASLLLTIIAAAFTGSLFNVNKDLDAALDVALERQQTAEQANARLQWENYIGSLAIIQKAAEDGNPVRARELLAQTPIEHRDWEWGRLSRQCRPAIWSLTDEDTPENTYGMLGKVELSADGRYMLCYRFHGAVKHVYDLQEGRNVFFKQFGASSGWIDATRFTPDGRYFHTPMDHQRVVLVDYLTDREVGVFDAKIEDLRSFAVSPNGKRAAGFVKIQPDKGKIILWEVPSGVILKEFPLEGLPLDAPGLLTGEMANRYMHPYVGKVLDFFTDNRRLAFTDTMLSVLDTDTGEIQTYAESLIVADFSPKSGIAAARDYQGVLDVWDLEKEVHIRTIDHHIGAGASIDISDDGREIATSAGGVMRLSIESGEILSTLNRHKMLVDISSNGKALATISSDSSRAFEIFSAEGTRDFDYIYFHDANGDRSKETFTRDWNIEPAYTFTADRSLFASGSDKGILSIWKIPSMERITRIAAHPDRIRWVAFSPDGQRIATAAEDSVKVWERTSAQPLFTVEPPTGMEMFTCAFSPDGQRLAVSGGHPQNNFGPENQTRVLDATTGEELFVVSGHKGTIRLVQFSPDGKWLLTGGYGPPEVADAPSIMFWDAATGSRFMGQINSMNWPWRVSFSQDNTKMLALGLSLDPIMWDLVNHSEIFRLKKATAFQAEFHPGGNRFVLATSQGVKIFSAIDGRELMTIGEGSLPMTFVNGGRDLLVNIDEERMKILHTDDWTNSNPNHDFTRRRQEAFALTRTDF